MIAEIFLPNEESLKIVSAVIILLLAVILTRIFSITLKRTGEAIKLSRDARKSASWIVNLIVYSFALVSALYALGYDVSTLLTGVGIFALAVGFAAQQLLSNIIAGFIIILEKPFKIGDLIAFDGRQGFVENIGLRSTLISTYDGNTVAVPNSNLVNSSLLNSTSGAREMVVSAAFILKSESDILKIVESARQVPSSIGGALVDKNHTVRVFLNPMEKLGAQRYSLELLFWIKDSRSEKPVLTDTTLAMKKILDKY